MSDESKPIAALRLRIDEMEAHIVELLVSLRDAPEDFDAAGDRLQAIEKLARVAYLEFERDWKPEEVTR